MERGPELYASQFGVTQSQLTQNSNQSLNLFRVMSR